MSAPYNGPTVDVAQVNVFNDRDELVSKLRALAAYARQCADTADTVEERQEARGKGMAYGAIAEMIDNAMFVDGFDRMPASLAIRRSQPTE